MSKSVVRCDMKYCDSTKEWLTMERAKPLTQLIDGIDMYALIRGFADESDFDCDVIAVGSLKYIQLMRADLCNKYRYESLEIKRWVDECKSILKDFIKRNTNALNYDEIFKGYDACRKNRGDSVSAMLEFTLGHYLDNYYYGMVFHESNLLKIFHKDLLVEEPPTFRPEPFNEYRIRDDENCLFIEKVQRKDDYVVINKSKLEGLVEDSNFLCALRAAGVDNWEGYSYAREFMDEEEIEDEDEEID